MRWIIEVTWTAPITDVLIDHRPVANGELIACEADFDVAWTSAGSVMTADGLIDGAQPPTVTWPHGSPAPVTVRPVNSVTGPAVDS